MDKKPKILILSNDLKKGGIEKIIINSIFYFNNRKYKTDLLLLKNTVLYKSILDRNINFEYILDKKNKFSTFNIFLNLKKLLSIFKKYNIIISHHDFSNYINVIFSNIFKSHKSIIVLHTYPKFYYYNQRNIIGFLKFALHKYLQKITYKFSNEIIVISNHLKEYVKHDIKKNSILIYNPLIKNTQKNTNYFHKDKKKFVCIGTLTKRKNHILILKVFNYLNKIGFLKEHNIQLEIIGEGSQFHNIRNYIIENNLSKYVKIMNNYENLDEIYLKSYCLISASNLEGIPNVFVESLASSLPIITSNIPAAFELSDDKNIHSYNIDKFMIVDYGIIFNRKSYLNLTNAIVYLINNHKKYCNIRSNIAKKEFKFSLENNSQYLKLIDTMLI